MQPKTLAVLAGAAFLVLSVGPHFLGAQAAVQYIVIHDHPSARGFKQPLGTITVSRGIVEFAEDNNPDHGFRLPCGEINNNLILDSGLLGPRLTVQTQQRRYHLYFPYKKVQLKHDQKVELIPSLYRMINSMCEVHAASALEAGRRIAEDAMGQEFKSGIVKVWQAVEESEPFAGIRGPYDLTGPGSNQWKSTIQLPMAQNCVLVKASASSASPTLLWTYLCRFGESEHYERVVNYVGSALNLAYAPDESAVGVNRVIFRDPKKVIGRSVFRSESIRN